MSSVVPFDFNGIVFARSSISLRSPRAIRCELMEPAALISGAMYRITGFSFKEPSKDAIDSMCVFTNMSSLFPMARIASGESVVNTRGSKETKSRFTSTRSLQRVTNSLLEVRRSMNASGTRPEQKKTCEYL